MAFQNDVTHKILMLDAKLMTRKKLCHKTHITLHKIYRFEKISINPSVIFPQIYCNTLSYTLMGFQNDAT